MQISYNEAGVQLSEGERTINIGVPQLPILGMVGADTLKQVSCRTSDGFALTFQRRDDGVLVSGGERHSSMLLTHEQAEGLHAAHAEAQG